MKMSKENKEAKSETMFGMTLTLDESLNKYKAPEYRPKKLDKAELKLRKGINFK